jgi:protocatechuate 3,4-dioxygenase beta subunit
VQVADAGGRVTFTSIFPAAYAGRWPHVHLEVYPDLARATGGDAAITTSPLAFPEAVCRQVYALPGYEDSVGNLDDVSLASDTVFADGVDAQLARTSGDPTTGLVAALTIPVA